VVFAQNISAASTSDDIPLSSHDSGIGTKSTVRAVCGLALIPHASRLGHTDMLVSPLFANSARAVCSSSA
jgi:hypothetical protein